MTNLVRLLFQSLDLDKKLLEVSCPNISYFKKIHFILLKYLQIVFMILGFNRNSRAYSCLINAQQNLESVYGFAGQQRLLVSHLSVILKLTKNTCFNLVVDVGANYGHFSILCVEYLKCSKIICIEADPFTFFKLSQNIDLYSNSNDCKSHFELINKIASDAVGKELIFYSDPKKSYLGKVAVLDDYILSDINYKKLESTNLNELLKEYSAVDLLKIDVEGHELEVLLGANLALSKTRYLFLECTKVEGNTFSRLISLLSNDIYDFELLHFRSLNGYGEGIYEAFDLLFVNKILL